jgi:signal transduction histidine kinase
MVAPTPKPWRVLLAVLLATLVVFGALIGGLTLQLRVRLRAEVLRREAEAIAAVVQLQLGAMPARFGETGAGDAIDDAFVAVLESVRLRGVLAVQLFDPTGIQRDALGTVPQLENIAAPTWPASLAEPVARFFDRAAVPPDPAEAPRVPVLDVAVPLRADGSETRMLGTARYWVDGSAVAAEFGRLDHSLAWQAGIAFAGAALVIAGVLAWAFARLAEANRRLVERRVDLARANQELDFAAKTGAIGAISAHLIHGLKNPLSGLEGFVADNASGAVADPAHGEAWRMAVDTTRRLRALVNEVVSVLRDEGDGRADYSLTVAEVVNAARTRVSAMADGAGVELVVSGPGAVELTARVGNLAGLVLANLLANEIEASPRGARVTLEAAGTEDRAAVEFLVRDAGRGVPDAVRGTLFRPLRSAKPGGGGVGLAISRQLARHAGGELELVRSDGEGTVFRLRVPAAAPA